MDALNIERILKVTEKYLVQDKVGFYQTPINQQEAICRIEEFFSGLDDEVDTLLLIGIGGSSLSPLTMYDTLKDSSCKKRFFCMDNIDSKQNEDILKNIIPQKTIVNVVSKSGSTVETMVNFFYTYRYFKQELKEKVSKHFVFTTSPRGGHLNTIAQKECIQTFPIPENVGGRFSAFTPVGTLLSVFLDFDTRALLKGAEDMSKSLLTSVEKNPALNYALIHHYLYCKKDINISVLMPYNSKLKKFTNWYQQLWAESLGKMKKNMAVGQTPLGSIGAIDQHALLQLFMEGPQDKIVTFIKVCQVEIDSIIENPFSYIKEFDLFNGVSVSTLLNHELEATSFSLLKNNKFNISIEIDKLNAYYLGQLFYFFMVSTFFSGILYDIDVFNQPGVEAGKIATKALLGFPEYQHIREEILQNKVF